MEEIKLARKLASNDYDTRRAAERALKDWLRGKSGAGLNEMEMRRLWKGLFASMFMSDKPLVQEQLATDLSLLVHLFPQYNQGILFCTIFFDTMSNEWHGIDRLRLDKFYMFIRRFTREMFVYLQAQGWPSSGVQEIMDKLISFKDKCNGLLLHVLELFLPEISALRFKVPEDPSLNLLKPWIRLIAECRDNTLVSVAEKGILDRLVKEKKIKRLTINWSKLNEVVWEWSSKPEILTRNRKILQKFYTQISEKVTPPT